MSVRRTATVSMMCLFAAQAAAAALSVRSAHLHNPYFPDLAPDAAPPSGAYMVGEAPKRMWAFDGDTVSVLLTVVSSAAQSVRVTAELVDGEKVIASLDGGALKLLRALDVRVEGNSNANCSCPAGQLPQGEGSRRVSCVAIDAAKEEATPKGCPSAAERQLIADRIVRAAPFSIKDPLLPLEPRDQPRLEAGVTELFMVDVPVDAAWPRTRLSLRIHVQGDGNDSGSVRTELQRSSIKLERFPAMDLSYWLSEDPRDLVAPPPGTALNTRWGGDWWSERHWTHIERAARLLARGGTTNVLVPLYVRDPFGLGARPLVPVRCITGSDVGPHDLIGKASGGARFNDEIQKWNYDFDFGGWRRWIAIFKAAGFRQFEGAHLLANGGELPVVLECDLYKAHDDAAPYARAFSFLPRSVGAGGSDVDKQARRSLYRQRFLAAFLPRLAEEVRGAGLEGSWLQHIIDENAPSGEAIAAYADAVESLREHMPKARTIDAINQYTAPRYKGLTDLPVFHLALIYDDQLPRHGIRRELDDAFAGKCKYFYNTALRASGPNRFIDTTPLESRATGWLAVETGYQGFLYWAGNRYRYPSAKDLDSIRRPADWTPLRYSQGPMPGGHIDPGYGAGGNWILYPTDAGLIDSIRARRLRDGLLDHWLYTMAEARCAGPACREQLAGVRRRLTRGSETIADFSRDPSDYDSARDMLVNIIEQGSGPVPQREENVKRK